MIKRIYLLFFFFCTIVCSQKILADSIPLKGDWHKSDIRSSAQIPFFVEKEENALYVYSCKKIENVTIRIISANTGEVFYEEKRMFLQSDCMWLPLDGLSDGEYVIEFRHNSSFGIGVFLIY